MDSSFIPHVLQTQGFVQVLLRVSRCGSSASQQVVGAGQASSTPVHSNPPCSHTSNHPPKKEPWVHARNFSAGCCQSPSLLGRSRAKACGVRALPELFAERSGSRAGLDGAQRCRANPPHGPWSRPVTLVQLPQQRFHGQRVLSRLLHPTLG